MEAIPTRWRAGRRYGRTHLDGIQPLVDAGNILAGGAMLDDDGNMRGSVLLVDFPSRVELDAWLDA